MHMFFALKENRDSLDGLVDALEMFFMVLCPLKIHQIREFSFLFIVYIAMSYIIVRTFSYFHITRKRSSEELQINIKGNLPFSCNHKFRASVFVFCMI